MSNFVLDLLFPSDEAPESPEAPEPSETGLTVDEFSAIMAQEQYDAKADALQVGGVRIKAPEGSSVFCIGGVYAYGSYQAPQDTASPMGLRFALEECTDSLAITDPYEYVQNIAKGHGATVSEETAQTASRTIFLSSWEENGDSVFNVYYPVWDGGLHPLVHLAIYSPLGIGDLYRDAIDEILASSVIPPTYAVGAGTLFPTVGFVKAGKTADGETWGVTYALVDGMVEVMDGNGTSGYAMSAEFLPRTWDFLRYLPPGAVAYDQGVEDTFEDVARHTLETLDDPDASIWATAALTDNCVAVLGWRPDETFVLDVYIYPIYAGDEADPLFCRFNFTRSQAEAVTKMLSSIHVGPAPSWVELQLSEAE